MKSKYKTLDSYEIEETPLYWFVGGLNYSRGENLFDADSIIQFPFTTYYTFKLKPLELDGILYRPLAEMKLPLLVIQYEDRCVCARLKPVLKTSEGYVYPFIGYNSDENNLKVILPERVDIKQKDAEWLGKGTSRTLENYSEGAEFELEFEEYENWREAIKDFFSDRKIRKGSGEVIEPNLFEKTKRNLYRSWDEDMGTFLQLPWRNKPGFAAVKYSYTLLSKEAERLNYFHEIFEETGDEEFEEWFERLKELFKDEKLYKEDLRSGKGLVWYNSLDFDGNELVGEFYLGTGYFGYPGGQATISRNLLEYLGREEDEELEELVRRNLKYITSTQKENGKWRLAIKQEPELPFKRHSYRNYESEGATGECVRALLMAYKRFGEDEYKKSALRGLESLENEYPLCKNALRDIGTDEIEGFSAFSVINAFLDAYELFGEDKYLKNAFDYSYYLLSWNYWFDAGDIDLRGVNHPISETITMRISPYETLLSAKVYDRISNYSEENFWDELSDLALRRSLEMRNKSNGLSEGIFFNFDGELKKLHTEQTFATSELLHSIFSLCKDKINLKKDSKDNWKNEEPAVKEGEVIFPEPRIIFEPEDMSLKMVSGIKTNSELVFQGPYSKRSGMKNHLLETFRGKKKPLMAFKNINYLWEGVKPSNKRFKEVAFSEVDKDSSLRIEDSKVLFRSESELHRIEGSVKCLRRENSYRIEIPFDIKTKKHDLYCEKVLYRLSDFDGNLKGKGFKLKLDNSDKTKKGFDLTLRSNWTHAGVYKGELVIEIES